MSKQERRIVTKIIRDLSLIMLESGHSNLNIDISETSAETCIALSAKEIEQDIIDTIEQKLNRGREIEVETYGWELLGDMKAHNKLDLLGRLIDRAEVTHEDGRIVLKIVRKNVYKK